MVLFLKSGSGTLGKAWLHQEVELLYRTMFVCLSHRKTEKRPQLGILFERWRMVSLFA